MQKFSIDAILTGNLPKGGHYEKINTEDPIMELYLRKMIEFDTGKRRQKELKEEIRKLKLQIK
jgi:hypothetical protein